MESLVAIPNYRKVHYLWRPQLDVQVNVPNDFHSRVCNKTFLIPGSLGDVTATTIAMTRATKKIARRLAQPPSSTATMENASTEIIGVTTTMTAAMAVMKRGKIIKNLDSRLCNKY